MKKSVPWRAWAVYVRKFSIRHSIEIDMIYASCLKVVLFRNPRVALIFVEVLVFLSKGTGLRECFEWRETT